MLGIIFASLCISSLKEESLVHDLNVQVSVKYRNENKRGEILEKSGLYVQQRVVSSENCIDAAFPLIKSSCETADGTARYC